MCVLRIWFRSSQSTSGSQVRPAVKCLRFSQRGLSVWKREVGFEALRLRICSSHVKRNSETGRRSSERSHTRLWYQHVVHLVMVGPPGMALYSMNSLVSMGISGHRIEGEKPGTRCTNSCAVHSASLKRANSTCCALLSHVTVCMHAYRHAKIHFSSYTCKLESKSAARGRTESTKSIESSVDDEWKFHSIRRS